MAEPRIPIPNEAIAEFCRRHHIRRLALFGSVLRDDFGPESDVDVLVEFDPDHIPGLAFFGMQDELTEILGRQVDLNTPGFISPYFRDRVQAEAVVLVQTYASQECLVSVKNRRSRVFVPKRVFTMVRSYRG